MNRITLSQAAAAQMARPNMDVESQSFKVLPMADNYNLVSDMLVLNRAAWHPWRDLKLLHEMMRS
ncbi:MAG TPA: hypothetical protein VGQ53_17395 [Chitinophagaceae bacterium]|jgi:hypothetical protein|nr:hypothetical protein [Chitinophagaceae bacterium]